MSPTALRSASNATERPSGEKAGDSGSSTVFIGIRSSIVARQHVLDDQRALFLGAHEIGEPVALRRPRHPRVRRLIDAHLHQVIEAEVLVEAAGQVADDRSVLRRDQDDVELLILAVDGDHRDQVARGRRRDRQRFRELAINTGGYHKRPDVTRQLLDDEAWVHTGDIGTIDEDGFVSVIDRKKELIITSSGKNIAPSNIENHLKESPLVGHALAFGDNRPYVVAILTLDPEIASIVGARHGITDTDLAALAQAPEIRAAVQQAVDAANTHLSRPEQVKRWTLLPTEWTAESAELTPTLKLRRRVVHGMYADEIDALYG